LVTNGHHLEKNQVNYNAFAWLQGKVSHKGPCFFEQFHSDVIIRMQ